jgi:DNA helicase-2/ATP-dependent DNA helicase PcrA
MDLANLLGIIGTIPNRRRIDLTNEQRSILEIPEGPLWIIAGPGSGKTEVLVLRCLRLLYVDQVNPRSILVTTFTEKAARELEDRITDYASWIASKAPARDVAKIDVTHLRIGTLHSLCNTILQEYRHPSYQNVRLMNELEQLIFINEHSDLVRRKPNGTSRDAQLWSAFGSLLGGWANVPVAKRMNRQLNRAIAFRNLVGRIIEYRVDVRKMSGEGGYWPCLAEGYEDYLSKLTALKRSDFSHVQATFLEFLSEPKGSLFLNGDESKEHPGVQHVLVDEYQDTNSIQEAIYLEMARRVPHNLMVVGDDDQAIYRFRGGSVESLIDFNMTCSAAWGMADGSIRPMALYDNFRSHYAIVEWCNHYISADPLMRKQGARAPGKRALRALSDINRKYGDYPSVVTITGPKIPDVARVFASFVYELLNEGIVTDPSDCALLMRSTRETRTWAGPYVQALNDRDIDVYNPRAKTFMDQIEVQAALGALLAVVDPQLQGCPPLLRRIVDSWAASFRQEAQASPDLSRYVIRAAAQIASKGPRTLLNTGTLELFYILLSFAPFAQWQNDLERSLRLAKLTSILEAYTAMPQPGRPERTRNWLATSSNGFEVSHRWRTGFYWGLVAILEMEGLDDEEDEYVPFPAGYLPVMTIFQAKGLQFPFVFVGTSQADTPAPSGAHQAEDLLYPFRKGVTFRSQRFQAQERAVQDYARLFYVAHSRAQYGLILLGTHEQLSQQVPHLGPGFTQWMNEREIPDLTVLPVR